MKTPFLIIGGGLSGLAAAIRLSHYCQDVLLLEQHSRIGGLNSYYYRNKHVLETGLHAITNYAPPEEKRAPINKLFRQLKIKRSSIKLHQQLKSEIIFSKHASLLFSNDEDLLISQIEEVFPESSSRFINLVEEIKVHNPFLPTKFTSTKKVLETKLQNPLLVEMLLCPLCYYGSSIENDMDYNQFVIMFKSIFLEGMFRPEGSMKDFLDTLRYHFERNGGKLMTGKKVTKILCTGKTVHGVELADGEIIETDHILSTIGYEETLELLDAPSPANAMGRLGFIESIFLVPANSATNLPKDKTILFFNTQEHFHYQRPSEPVDFTSGVLCFPQNFVKAEQKDTTEIRVTHLANYHQWNNAYQSRENYKEMKNISSEKSVAVAEKIIGNFSHNIVYKDTFTPVTIKRYTSKKEGAIYGNPLKIKDGDIGYQNLFLAGTDQGFLGIIGSMLSGVSIANQHFLPKI